MALIQRKLTTEEASELMEYLRGLDKRMGRKPGEYQVISGNVAISHTRTSAFGR